MSDEMNVDLRIVSVDTVIELCEELGCSVKKLKSYWQVEAPEYNKKAIYVGLAKRRMTRLDVAGFIPEDHPAIDIHDAAWAKDLKLGAVRAQILPKELRDEEDDVLEAVRACVRGLLDETEGFKLGKRNKEEADVHAEDCTGANDEETQELAAEIG